MHRSWLTLSILSILFGCSAPRARSIDQSACERQANEEYQRCRNPQFVTFGGPHQLPNSQELQACERSHRQALGVCAGRGDAEMPRIDLTGTSSRAD